MRLSGTASQILYLIAAVALTVLVVRHVGPKCPHTHSASSSSPQQPEANFQPSGRTAVKWEEEEVLDEIIAAALHPGYGRLEPEDIENQKKEYRERLDRVESVCKGLKKSGWYQSEIMPKEYPTLEEWIKSINKSEETLNRMNRQRDEIYNLKLSGMNFNELKLQVDTKHNLLYCDLPQAGSSTWEKLMMELQLGNEYGLKTNHIHHTVMDQNRFLYSFHPDEQIRRLSEDYKFMFVRHPFERLLSAYYHEISHIDQRNFEEDIWGRIHRGNRYEVHYGQSAYQSLDLSKYKTLNRALDIAGFHQFIHYLIARGPGGDHMGRTWETRQRHWRRYIDVCKVCSIKWDFIGKMEHFNQDHNYMMDQLNLIEEVGWMEKEKVIYAQNHFYQYYAGLSKETIEQLYELFKPDFDLFGYKIPAGLGAAPGRGE